jgi:hypothetical protein
MRLHTLFAKAACEQRLITHAIVEGKGGRRALQAKVFIDATGDADLAASAGVPCSKGRLSDGKTQSMTLIFAVGNIDTARFADWGGYDRLVDVYKSVALAQEFRNPRRADLSGCWAASNRMG